MFPVFDDELFLQMLAAEIDRVFSRNTLAAPFFIGYPYLRLGRFLTFASAGTSLTLNAHPALSG
ncbi:MAG: hypothetical protein WBC78_13690 [Candidatus Sulfotelmatobacter sp.]